MLKLVNNFNKLVKYPKVKLGPSYEEKVKEFSRNSETLLDVFCYDEKKRSEIEKSFQLKMTESECKFFEDQESLRQAKCVKMQEKSTPSVIRFQRRCRSADGKYSRMVEIEEHIVMVGQPGEFYLIHTSLILELILEQAQVCATIL